MLRFLTIATVLRLICCAKGENAEGTGGLPDEIVQGTQDRVGLLARVLRSPYEEHPRTRQRRFF